VKMHRYGTLAAGAVLFGAAMVLAAGLASATPNINSVVMCPRVFNDDPFSTLTIVNAYPGQIIYDDVASSGATGFANLHVWKLSTNSVDIDVFSNTDHFRVCADLLITGNGECEAGLMINPWWNLGNCGDDGRFNVRTTDGEIACFGGRMPFFSFTGNFGITYVKGTPIHLEMLYTANDTTMANPATIQYSLTYNAVNYTSGPLAYDQGNPNENPPHGTWGMLTPAAVGGHVQYFVGTSMGGNARAEWDNICYENYDVIPVEPTTWGAVKALYR